MKQLILTISLALITTQVNAAPMLHVVDVRDGRTLVVERNGALVDVQLAGVDVPPDRNEGATALLRELALHRFVMIEGDAAGAYVYRSPDALLLNRVIAARIFDDSRSQREMTYLGEVEPGKRQPATRTATAAVQTRASQRPRSTPARSIRAQPRVRR